MFIIHFLCCRSSENLYSVIQWTKKNDTFYVTRMSSVSKSCPVINYPILNIVHKYRFSKSKCIYFEEFVVPSIICHIMWENGLYEQLQWYAISVISDPWNVQCNGYIIFVRCSDNRRFWGFCIYMIIPSIKLILSSEHWVISQLN